MKKLEEHIKDRIKSCNQNAYAASRCAEAQRWVDKRKIYEEWLRSTSDNNQQMTWETFNNKAKKLGL